MTRAARTAHWLGMVPLLALLAAWPAADAGADMMSFQATQDTTLFQYDPNDLNDSFSGNGSGNFFSAGVTFSRSEIQRGLLQFDLSGLPENVLITSARLDLYVLDVPKKDNQSSRPFWLVPVPALERAWGEGDSAADYGASGAGSGAPADPGDATWLHTTYDPALHGSPPSLDPFVADGPGFWPALGVLGDAPYTLADPPAGTTNGGDLGPFSLSSASMVDDLSGWLADPASNFGWLLLGDESVDDASHSSKRGFASSEHATAAWRPLLTVEYSSVPEPGTGLLALLAAGLTGTCAGHRRRRERR